MAYRVDFNGVTVVCDTAREVSELLEQHHRPVKMDTHIGAAMLRLRNRGNPNGPGKNALPLLEMLATTHSITVKDLVSHFHLTDAKSMGPLMNSIFHLARSVGLKRDDLIGLVAGPDGNRTCVAGPRLAEGLRRIKAQRKGEDDET